MTNANATEQLDPFALAGRNGEIAPVAPANRASDHAGAEVGMTAPAGAVPAALPPDPTRPAMPDTHVVQLTVPAGAGDDAALLGADRKLRRLLDEGYDLGQADVDAVINERGDRIGECIEILNAARPATLAGCAAKLRLLVDDQVGMGACDRDDNLPSLHQVLACIEAGEVPPVPALGRHDGDEAVLSLFREWLRLADTCDQIIKATGCDAEEVKVVFAKLDTIEDQIVATRGSASALAIKSYLRIKRDDAKGWAPKTGMLRWGDIEDDPDDLTLSILRDCVAAVPELDELTTALLHDDAVLIDADTRIEWARWVLAEDAKRTPEKRASEAWRAWVEGRSAAALNLLVATEPKTDRGRAIKAANDSEKEPPRSVRGLHQRLVTLDRDYCDTCVRLDRLGPFPTPHVEVLGIRCEDEAAIDATLADRDPRRRVLMSSIVERLRLQLGDDAADCEEPTLSVAEIERLRESAKADLARGRAEHIAAHARSGAQELTDRQAVLEGEMDDVIADIVEMPAQGLEEIAALVDIVLDSSGTVLAPDSDTAGALAGTALVRAIKRLVPGFQFVTYLPAGV